MSVIKVIQSLGVFFSPGDFVVFMAVFGTVLMFLSFDFTLNAIFLWVIYVKFCNLTQ